MKRFKSPRQAQRFLSTHDQIANLFSRHPDQDTVVKFHSARIQVALLHRSAVVEVGSLG
jgi:putative transposase